MLVLDTIESRSSVVLRRGSRKKGGNTKLLPEIAKNGGWGKITGKCQPEKR